MILLNRDGTLTTSGAPERVTGATRETIEVPDELVAQQPDLLDRIFTFAFDVLGLQMLDVRIRPAHVDRSAGALCHAPCL
jgi:hypothetical protein